MRTRLSFIVCGLIAALAALYLASPLLAAHKLREAIRAGNAQTVKRMIEWPSFRASIRATVTQNANLLPVARNVARSIRPTWWQRIRSMFGHSMLDRFMERYITPKGLSELYRAKTNWHERFGRSQPRVAQAAIISDRLIRALRRIRSLGFKGPFRFVMEMEDRHKANRLIKSTFQLASVSLSGFHWKLTAIAIRQISPGNNSAKPQLARLNGF